MMVSNCIIWYSVLLFSTCFLSNAILLNEENNDVMVEEFTNNSLQYRDDSIINPHSNYFHMVDTFMKALSSSNRTLENFNSKEFSENFQLSNILMDDNFIFEFDENNACHNDLMTIIDASKLSQLWALTVIDSWGKPQPGLFGGATKWPGDYETCLSSASPPANHQRIIRGQYCDSYIVLSYAKGKQFTLQIGSCIPDSCNNKDWNSVLNETVNRMNLTAVESVTSNCHPKWGSIPLSNGAISMIVILSLICGIIFAGTLVDLWYCTNLFQFAESTSSNRSPSRVDLLEETRGDGEENGQDEATESSLQDCSPPSSYSSGSTPWYQNEACYDRNLELAELPILVKILCAFSVCRNVNKLFNLDNSRNSGVLRCVHGMRFLSMCWIILGHSYFFAMLNTNNFLTFAFKLFNSKSFSVILNGQLSVDTFFFLSGLLTAYLFYKAVENNGGPFANINFWEMFYFHRFWRLTPPYMLFMGTYSTLLIYLWQGPFWPSSQPGFDSNCESNWWTNFLYINNIVHSKNMCMGWSWYLANDMQFYVISPFLMVPFYYSKVAGAIVHLLFLIGTMLATGLISSINKFGPNDYSVQGDGFILIYIKPWCRFAPYVIGMVIGYVLYKTNCRVRLHRAVVMVGWCLSLALNLSMIYSIYPAQHNNISSSLAAFYNSTTRVGWSISLAWIVFACCTGNGGIIDRFLSWNVFVPLSRLTYCAYLVHPVVMLFFYLSLDTPLYLNHSTVVVLYLGFTLCSYGVAFVVSMMFEAPMLNLEKVILKNVNA